MKVIAFVKLNKETDREDYKKWSKEVDMKTTPKAPGVKSFVVNEIKEMADYYGEKIRSEESDYDFIEIAEIDNIETFKNLAKIDFMKPLVPIWQKYCDKSKSKVFYIDEI